MPSVPQHSTETVEIVFQQHERSFA